MTQVNLEPDFPVLIGDIGGTNARFSFILSPQDSFHEPFVFTTTDFSNIDDVLHQILLHSPVKPRSAIFAVAGRVEGNEIALTNCNWVIRPSKIMSDTGLLNILVMNDFEAQAISVLSLQKNDFHQIGGEVKNNDGARLVLGPGTGLGVCTLFNSSGEWVPVPGEGGHIDIGPRTPRDYQIFPYIQKMCGRVSAEKILSGQGLLNVYRAVALADGKKANLQTPSEITEAASFGKDEIALETLKFFATALARFSGDLALVFMSYGGVFLTGGIPQKIISFLESPSFRDSFEDKAPHQDFLKKIPVFVVINPWAPFEGLTSYVHKKFHIQTKGRLWSQTSSDSSFLRKSF